MLDNLQSGSTARVVPFLETNFMTAMRKLILRGAWVAIMTSGARWQSLRVRCDRFARRAGALSHPGVNVASRPTFRAPVTICEVF